VYQTYAIRLWFGRCIEIVEIHDKSKSYRDCRHFVVERAVSIVYNISHLALWYLRSCKCSNKRGIRTSACKLTWNARALWWRFNNFSIPSSRPSTMAHDGSFISRPNNTLQASSGLLAWSSSVLEMREPYSLFVLSFERIAWSSLDASLLFLSMDKSVNKSLAASCNKTLSLFIPLKRKCASRKDINNCIGVINTSDSLDSLQRDNPTRSLWSCLPSLKITC
jgi:hypothetical protein